jgi:hypothetical protein
MSWQPGSKLQNVITFATFTAGIATAISGFGIGLLAAPADVSQPQRDILIIGLIVIVFSVIGAIFTFMNLVFQTAQATENLSSDALRLPLALQIVALAVGLILFAALIGARLASQMPYSSMTVRDANVAVATASSIIPRHLRILRINRVDVIRGLSTSDSNGTVWFVGAIVCAPRRCAKEASQREMDVIIDAASGRSRIIAGP